ncbi:MAG TPA: hypothetical protein VL051_02665 [Burkholderiaceae bacterium]|nr:hypothetical protein [Burkholderiaceae bacterium]
MSVVVRYFSGHATDTARGIRQLEGDTATAVSDLLHAMAAMQRGARQAQDRIFRRSRR